MSDGWTRGRCVVLAFLILLAGGCGGEVAEPGRHVILISLDTLRADHLGCYGNTRIQTPVIDGLASAGTLFRDVSAAAPTTLASHTSMFTGTYPHAHGVVRNGYLVNRENEMLPEILGSAGFRTAAFLGSFALESRFGFDQGFDSFDESFDLETDWESYDQNQRSARSVTDAALHWVNGVVDERLFMFVHYFDAHMSYAPPPPFDRMYTAAGGPATSGLADVEQAIQAQQDRITQAGPGLFGVIEQGLSLELLEGAAGNPNPLDQHLANLYAGEVSYVDEQIGRLLDGLKRRGILDEAIVIVTADHGETFWEHADFWNHGLCVYQTTVQVPLIVRLPEAFPVVHSVDTAVSAVDILPTVLDLLGLPIPAGVEGISLRPAIEDQPFDHGPVFAEATQPVGRLEQGVDWGNTLKAKTVRQGPWKYIWTPYLDHEELYNLKQDPHELTNLLAEPTTAIRQRRDGLRAELDAWIATGHPLPSRFNPEQQHEVMERLRSLGYVGGGDSVD